MSWSPGFPNDLPTTTAVSRKNNGTSGRGCGIWVRGKPAFPSRGMPLVDGPPDGPAFLAELALKIGQVIEVVRRRPGVGRRELLELCLLREQLLSHLEVVFHVRGEV